MRAGVLVVRAWLEGDDQHLRARVTRTDDVLGAREEEWTSVATSVDEVCEIVRAWLERVDSA